LTRCSTLVARIDFPGIPLEDTGKVISEFYAIQGRRDYQMCMENLPISR